MKDEEGNVKERSMSRHILKLLASNFVLIGTFYFCPFIFRLDGLQLTMH